MKERGIDISRHQGRNNNFDVVKKNGYSFVMIKAGGADGGLYQDMCFEENYSRAKAAGMNVGCYFFTGANFYTAEEGVREARHFLSIIKGKTFEYPVAVDVEAVSPAKGVHGITTATVAFCEEMEKAGYYVTIYASDVSGFKDRLDISRLKAYDKWVAKYSTNPPHYMRKYGMWQYGGSTNYINSPNVPGITQNPCDQNYSYKDYPAIMRESGLNGFAKKVYNITITCDENNKNKVVSLLNNTGIKHIVSEV